MYSNHQYSVLGYYLYTLTHEPSHFETDGLVRFDSPRVFADANTQYTFTHVNGLSLIGRKKGEQAESQFFRHSDELPIYIRQRELIAPVVGRSFEQYPGYTDDILDLAQQFFVKIGYHRPIDLPELRIGRAEKMIERVATRLAAQIKPAGSTPQTRAIAYLDNLDAAIESRQTSRIRLIIGLLPNS